MGGCQLDSAERCSYHRYTQALEHKYGMKHQDEVFRARFRASHTDSKDGNQVLCNSYRRGGRTNPWAACVDQLWWCLDMGSHSRDDCRESGGDMQRLEAQDDLGQEAGKLRPPD